MYIEYDEEANGAFLWLVDDIDKEKEGYYSEIWPKDLNDEIGLLFTSDNKLLGIEILSASKYLSKKLLDSSIPTGQRRN